MPLRKSQYCTKTGLSKPRFFFTAAMSAADGAFPMYCAANWSPVCPASFGSTKKMPKVTALTISSRITALINLRMMYANTGLRRRHRGPARPARGSPCLHLPFGLATS